MKRMKSRSFLVMMLMAVFTVIGVTSCNEDDEEGRKVTDYKEYTLTVASVKLPGVLNRVVVMYLQMYML